MTKSLSGTRRGRPTTTVRSLRSTPPPNILHKWYSCHHHHRYHDHHHDHRYHCYHDQDPDDASQVWSGSRAMGVGLAAAADRPGKWIIVVKYVDHHHHHYDHH